MSNLQSYHDDLAHAISERETAQDELFQDILRLPPQERAALPPEQYTRLSPQQFAILLGEEPQIEGLHDQQTATPLDDTGSQPSKVWLWGVTKSPLLIAFVVAIFIAMGSVGLSLGTHYVMSSLIQTDPLVRSADASTWPPCPRLSKHSDGCVYTVQMGIPWSHAAQQLRMEEQPLRASNQHLANTTNLTEGTQIVIWRGLGRLAK